MDKQKPTRIYRKDYKQPDYWIDTIDLRFELGEMVTQVKTKLNVRYNESVNQNLKPLTLHGEGLVLKNVWLDGMELHPNEYKVDEETLTLNQNPKQFILETLVEIKPQENTLLEGLYKSSGNFCTQCEAEGFRRITYFLDRPDVMARYSTTIVANKARYPVLLSNGNRVESGESENGSHWVRWNDPFPKPSYLFALVAGNLQCHRGEFITKSGRSIQLEIWVEPQNIHKCEHALRSLQKAMRWDEEVFGLEYDLDTYMIVAVNDFNMGAMENKGLNVFNSKYVLAQPETATDGDYEGIEGVIAHEYFHNWTGNRVTCRDWFQLTLKEGLTVFRDQWFSAEMTSEAVKRIDEVNGLRTMQFAEDSGPMAHPIRPESYIEMNNFYTSTVYSKGAEVARMYRTLLGQDGFRKGMDLYFKRHDGQAVTCDDFRSAMADANRKDLTQFERWYTQSGTPIVEAKGEYDESKHTYTLILKQSNVLKKDEYLPLHIPIAIGLIGKYGQDIPFLLEGETHALQKEGAKFTRIIEFTKTEQSFCFTHVNEKPVVSLFRHFSAPVKVKIERSKEELSFLMGHDSDAFNRWDAGQTLAQVLLLDLVKDWQAGRELELEPLFVDSFKKVLLDTSLDGSLKSVALSLPNEKLLGQQMDIIDVDAIRAARHFVRKTLATKLQDELQNIYNTLYSTKPYVLDKTSIDNRRLKNMVLGFLTILHTPDTIQLAMKQFESANNMTDSQAALLHLVDTESKERNTALEIFYQRWKHEPLVLDKWFSLQALSQREDTFEQVVSLSEHPNFTLKNPNRVYALISSFCAWNQVRFHRADGAAYRFLADKILTLNDMNPQVAARLVSIFNHWKRFDTERQSLMKEQLKRIISHEGLSKDVYEIVDRNLQDT
ncbi:MAG: aminopeptidase N [Leptospiraceae bacterium]|nr:aminopeptidase N [Leptospiraceae bacterium]